jgi:hypothetical protein
MREYALLLGAPSKVFSPLDILPKPTWIEISKSFS